MSWKINDKSSIMVQPDKLKLPLRKHQLAMLHRCLSIEKNAYIRQFPYSIMSDKAGAGKTAVIISLILADKTMYGKTQNLIIVPQNIHTQWVKEFEKFTGDAVKVKSFIEYSDISEIFFNNNILNEYDVLITTVLYYDMIINILEQTGSNIRRLIFDEIDTLYNIIENLEQKKKMKKSAKEMFNNGMVEKSENIIGSKNKIIWFISASFENSLTDKGFKFRDKIISTNELSNIICKCDDDFIDNNNFNIENPIIKSYNCDDISDEYFNCLSSNQLDYINSLSFQNISSVYTNKVSSSSIEVIKNVINDYYESIKKATVAIEDLKKNKIITEKIENEINTLNKNISFYDKILILFHKVKCEDNCDNKKDCIIKNIDSISYNNSKIRNIEQIFKNIDKTKDKILIFSDFTGSFKIISNMLEKYEIKYTELDGGNIKLIDKSLDLYKNKDTTVLMIDSSSQGCGINLENTSHLIFIHKTSEILYNQILGRALRPGRTCQLKIITFLNKNEII